jgi:hypothetical protein
VKVSSADTGGSFALMENNLKLEFALGLHLHRQHAETCYILEARSISTSTATGWPRAGRVSIYLQVCRIGCKADQKEWLHRKIIVAAFRQTLGICSGLPSVAVWNIGAEGHVDPLRCPA